jgi:NAD+ synthase
MITRDSLAARLDLNAELASEVLADFVRDAVETTGSQGVVVGLSGGIDSAVSCTIAVSSLGPDRVHAFFLPYRTSSPRSVEDAEAVAQQLGLELRTIDISEMVDGYFDRFDPDADQVRRGNKMSRERMSILFDQSKKLGCLVLGTSNKTEILLGYSTIFGDNASSINPLGDLYKRQVTQIARHHALPESVIEKPPSADLWPDQTDEDELGLTYAEADEVLYLLFDLGMSPDEIVDVGYDPETVSRVVSLEQANRYKRRLMLVARISNSAINLDREIPRD